MNFTFKNSSFGKHEQLCGWSHSTTPSYDSPLPSKRVATKKQRSSKTATQNNNSNNNNSRATKSSTKPNGSRWQLHQNIAANQIDFEYTFQHCTDTSQYISSYRKSKLAKIHDAFSDEIQEMLNQRQSEICADLAAPVDHNTRRVCAGGSSVYIPTPVEPEEYPMSYRVDSQQKQKDRYN